MLYGYATRMKLLCVFSTSHVDCGRHVRQNDSPTLSRVRTCLCPVEVTANYSSCSCMHDDSHSHPRAETPGNGATGIDSLPIPEPRHSKPWQACTPLFIAMAMCKLEDPFSIPLACLCWFPSTVTLLSYLPAAVGLEHEDFVASACVLRGLLVRWGIGSV